MKQHAKPKASAPKRKTNPAASSPAHERRVSPLNILKWPIGPAHAVGEAEDGADVYAAHADDIPDIRKDLRILGNRILKLDLLVATLEFTQAELERKLIATQQRLELTVTLGNQITRLEEWLTSGAIHKDLQQLCERQLTEMDKRLAELPARSARANQEAKSNE